MSAVEMSRRERILARLEELGGNGPKRSLGQNFLVSDTVVDKILFAVRSEVFTELIEVGPGLGALTEDLLKLHKPITLIELDRRFAEYWRQRSAARNGDLASDLASDPAADPASGPDRVIEADALRYDWTELKLLPGALFVSNLPYQISSSIAIERCLEPAGITRMILMFQKEVAQRISARAATKEYGFLTAIIQIFWETQTVCDAGPQAFFPPPNVSSRVLQFRRRHLNWLEKGEGTANGVLQLTKAAFSHRRKLMLRNLQGSYFNGDREVVPALEAVFAKCGLNPRSSRAEELDPEAFVQLYLTLESEGLKRYGNP